jgi:hypothetical protein
MANKSGKFVAYTTNKYGYFKEKRENKEVVRKSNQLKI